MSGSATFGRTRRRSTPAWSCCTSATNNRRRQVDEGGRGAVHYRLISHDAGLSGPFLWCQLAFVAARPLRGHPQGVLGDFQVVAGLQVQPVAVGGVEEAGEPQCGVGLYRSAADTIWLIRDRGTPSAWASRDWLISNSSRSSARISPGWTGGMLETHRSLLRSAQFCGEGELVAERTQQIRAGVGSGGRRAILLGPQRSRLLPRWSRSSSTSTPTRSWRWL